MTSVIFLQPGPIVVDVIRQPQPARDISVDTVLTMFASAGIVLLVAAIGGLVVGAVFVGIRRLQELNAPPSNETSHVKLRI